MEKLVISLPDETATIALGAALAAASSSSSSSFKSYVIYLSGALGTGKTTVCRGFLRALGYTGKVKSPTYTMVEPYLLAPWTVYHFDLYRITDADELELIGIRDYFHNHAVCLIEWPQRGTDLLPVADIAITLFYQQYGRCAEAEVTTAATRQCLLSELDNAELKIRQR